MVLRKTERGFDVYDEFEDTYHAKVSVQESSAFEDRVWVFITQDPNLRKRGMGAAHLDIEGVDRLIAALQEWRNEKA